MAKTQKLETENVSSRRRQSWLEMCCWNLSFMWVVLVF